MALAFSVRFDFVDQKGKKSNTKIHIPTGFTIAQMVEFAQGAAQLFLNASTGELTGASIVLDTPLGSLGLDVTPSSVSKVARKLYLGFSTAVNGFFGKTLLPTLSESLVIAGTDAVDQTNVDVAALISAIEDGIVVVGGTMTFTNHRGMDIVSTTAAREQFRRRQAS